MPSLQMLQAVSSRASRVGSNATFQVFLAYNVVIYTMFTVLWWRYGLAECKLPGDAPVPSLRTAAYVAGIAHISFNMPGEIVPQTHRARMLLAVHAGLAWSGLLLWASSWK